MEIENSTAKLSLTSLVVINVATRASLVAKTKEQRIILFQWLAHFE